MKKKITMTVTDIRSLAEGVFSMKLRYPEGDMPKEVRPGQFAGLYTNDPSKLLYVAEKLSELWECPAEQAARICYENSLKLFGL